MCSSFEGKVKKFYTGCFFKCQFQKTNSSIILKVISKICKKLMEHEIGTFDNLARKSAKYKKIKSTNSFKVYPIFLHPIFFTKFSTTTFSVKLLELVGIFFLKLQVSTVILMYFES